MKKLFFYLIILSSLTTIVKAQSLIVDSTRFVGGTKGATIFEHSISTKDKGILLVGLESYNPGGIIPSFPLDTIFYNVLIVKIDSNQQISWLKVYGGTRDDQAVSACQTPDGGYAVLATTWSNNGNVTGFKGGEDIWLLRIDSNGNLLWEKTYGGSASGISIANTPDNGFIILGSGTGADTDVPFHYGSSLIEDWVVVKTDSMGNKQWCKDLGGTQQEASIGSILAIDTAYYLISSSNSIDHDCTDTFWHAGIDTWEDYHMLKLDKSGNVLWDSSYGGSANDYINYAMYDARDSTIMIVGGTGSNDYMVTDYQGGGDFWVLKVNRNGTLVWKKTLGGISKDYGNSICITPNGGYLVVGSTDTGILAIHHIKLFCLDNASNEITSKIFGGLNDDDVSSVIPYLDGYVASGYSGSQIFTEGICNMNYSGAFISYIDYWPLTVLNFNNEEQLKIYPNPIKDKVTIYLPNRNGNIQIINSIGQLIYNKQTDQQNMEINTTEWNKGLYLIKYQSETGIVLTGKIIKN